MSARRLAPWLSEVFRTPESCFGPSCAKPRRSRTGNVAGDSNVDVRIRNEVGLGVYLLTRERYDVTQFFQRQSGGFCTQWAPLQHQPLGRSEPLLRHAFTAGCGLRCFATWWRKRVSSCFERPVLRQNVAENQRAGLSRKSISYATNQTILQSRRWCRSCVVLGNRGQQPCGSALWDARPE